MTKHSLDRSCGAAGAQTARQAWNGTGCEQGDLKQPKDGISSKCRMGVTTYRTWSHKAFPEDREAPGEQCVNKMFNTSTKHTITWRGILRRWLPELVRISKCLNLVKQIKKNFYFPVKHFLWNLEQPTRAHNWIYSSRNEASNYHLPLWHPLTFLTVLCLSN